MSDRTVADTARSRLFVLASLVLAMVLALVGRLWFLQVAQGGQAQHTATLNATQKAVTTATRGLLLDDRGTALVANETALVVTVDRVALTRLGQVKRDPVLYALSNIIGVDANTIWKEVRLCTYKKIIGPDGKKTSEITNLPCWTGGRLQPVPVATFDTQAAGVDSSEIARKVLEIEQNPDKYPGIAVVSEAVRAYPETGAVAGTSLAAHLLGYTAPITGDDIRANPALKTAPSTDELGRDGLEKEYDAELRGTDGTQTIAVNAAGDPLRTIANTAPEAGADVVTNLDAPIQLATEQALQTALTKYAPAVGKHPTDASAVVLTTDGRVVAMASTPSYDPSVFTGGVSTKTYESLRSAANDDPLLNRAMNGVYLPGSTWKPIMTAAILDHGIATTNTTTACPPSLPFGTSTFKNFEGESSGSLTFDEALTISCDTVFYKYGGGEWIRDGNFRVTAAEKATPAKEALAKEAIAYGFGKATGIDLPGEVSGNIATRESVLAEWNKNKAEYCKGAKERPKGSFRQAFDQERCTDGWRYGQGDAVQFAIGQGQFVGVTPLQLARAYAAIANGGTLYAPTLAKAIVRPDGTVVRQITPKVEGHVPTANLAYIRQALFDVVHDPKGTAYQVFKDYPVQVSGKTGTAEVFHTDAQGNQVEEDTSWFASFAPSNNPKYIVLVSVPNSEQGAHVAAPAVRDIYDAIFGVVNGVVDRGLAHGRALPTTLPCFQTDTGKVGSPSRTCSASITTVPSPSASPSQPSASASSAPATTDTFGTAVGAALTPDRRRGPP